MKAEDLSKLSAPFPKEDIHWRAQTVRDMSGAFKALALAYIDARDLFDRLDEVCGPTGWQSEHYDAGNGRLGCRIGILVDGEWIWKSDGAGATDVEADKGAFSDALKRAAVSWGVARYLYGLGNTWVPCEAREDGKDKWGRPKYRFIKFKCDPWECVKNTEKDEWHGPLGKHQLTEEMRALSRVMNGETLITTGDLEEKQMEYAEVIKQANRDLPDWARAYEKRCKQLRSTLQVGPPSRETAAAQ